MGFITFLITFRRGVHFKTQADHEEKVVKVFRCFFHGLNSAKVIIDPRDHIENVRTLKNLVGIVSNVREHVADQHVIARRKSDRLLLQPSVSLDLLFVTARRYSNGTKYTVCSVRNLEKYEVNDLLVLSHCQHKFGCLSLKNYDSTAVPLTNTDNNDTNICSPKTVTAQSC